MGSFRASGEVRWFHIIPTDFCRTAISFNSALLHIADFWLKYLYTKFLYELLFSSAMGHHGRTQQWPNYFNRGDESSVSSSLNEVKKTEVAMTSAGPYIQLICTSLQTDNQVTIPAPHH